MELLDATIVSPVREWNRHELANQGPQSAGREELREWALASPEIQKVVACDLLLYDLSLSIFKRQAADALGIVWTTGGTSLDREPTA